MKCLARILSQKKYTHHLIANISMLLCFLSIVGITTACSIDMNTYSELSSLETSESPVVSEEEKIAIDPLIEYRAESNNYVPFGNEAILDDSETGISYRVRITSLEYSNNFNELGIQPSDIDDYLFEIGNISAEGFAEEGYTFMMVSFEVAKETDSSTEQSDYYLKYFSLSDSSLFQNDVEQCERILVGFTQPDETRADEEDMKYFMHLTDVGSVVQCSIFYMVRDTDQPIVLSVRYFDDIVMFSLEE